MKSVVMVMMKVDKDIVVERFDVCRTLNMAFHPDIDVIKVQKVQAQSILIRETFLFI